MNDMQVAALPIHMGILLCAPNSYNFFLLLIIIWNR
jgi:hypothetical protein